MVAKSAAKPSARERLLAAADELFYDEGVRAVGIDRIIEQAGVAKASLYNVFGSKDELIEAYLEARHARIVARITKHLERYDTPRERILGVFEAQGQSFIDSGYRGCAFVRANAEAHQGDLVDQASKTYRGWVRATFAELTEQAGAGDPATLARQLHQLYDGAGVSSRMDRDSEAAAAARSAASALLDAFLPPANHDNG
jgi:AcrR family transcriptional regulator